MEYLMACIISGLNSEHQQVKWSIPRQPKRKQQQWKNGTKLFYFRGNKFHLFYEPEYVIHCIGNLQENKSCVSMSECPIGMHRPTRRYVENRI
jgi:hypothetical protein